MLKCQIMHLYLLMFVDIERHKWLKVDVLPVKCKAARSGDWVSTWPHSSATPGTNCTTPGGMPASCSASSMWKQSKSRIYGTKRRKKKASKETAKYTKKNKHVHSVTSEYGRVTWLPQDDITHDSRSHYLYICEDGVAAGAPQLGKQSILIESQNVPSCSQWPRN